MAFKKAVKSQSKLRAAMFGPSGAGKTYSALAIASGMGTKIALIDSERSSASLYADRFDFDQVDLVDKTVDEYVHNINEAAEAGYDVLIIDSLSHAWEVLNEEVQKIADTSFRGNFWSAWSKGTPMQRKLINSIVSFPGHIIATMRSKTEWQAGASEGGKKAGPVRVGLAPEQGKGIEYEFTILFELSVDHLAHVIKDRTGKFQDKILEKPGKKFGEELVAWLNEGVPDLEEICLTRKKELGNVLKATDEAGPLFNESEIEICRQELRKLYGVPFESQLPIIDKLLNVKKKELAKRLEAAKASAAPVKPVRGNLEATAAVAEAELNNMADNGFPPDPAPDLPGMYQEEEPPEEQAAENSFDDDIPWEDDKEGHKTKAEKPGPDLDIF